MSGGLLRQGLNSVKREDQSACGEVLEFAGEKKDAHFTRRRGSGRTRGRPAAEATPKIMGEGVRGWPGGGDT
jgi:hypothetical protein